MTTQTTPFIFCWTVSPKKPSLMPDGVFVLRALTRLSKKAPERTKLVTEKIREIELTNSETIILRKFITR
jgi:hypothetical protein